MGVPVHFGTAPFVREMGGVAKWGFVGPPTPGSRLSMKSASVYSRQSEPGVGGRMGLHFAISPIP